VPTSKRLQSRSSARSHATARSHTTARSHVTAQWRPRQRPPSPHLQNTLVPRLLHRVSRHALFSAPALYAACVRAEVAAHARACVPHWGGTCAASLSSGDSQGVGRGARVWCAVSWGSLAQLVEAGAHACIHLQPSEPVSACAVGHARASVVAGHCILCVVFRGKKVCCRARRASRNLSS
jgi:hypothetical protein